MQQLATDAGAAAVGGDGEEIEMGDPIAVFHNAKTGEAIVEAGDEHVGIFGIDARYHPLCRPAPKQSVLDQFP